MDIKKKIMVVDNDPVILKFMTDLLEKKGHRVIIAADGLSALDILKAETPDIIFTDLIMPNIDGEKLCRIIRTTPTLKATHLIVFTAVAIEQDVDFRAYGADACIAKGPLNILKQHVLTAIDRVDHKAPTAFSGQTLGFESAFPRQITQELLSLKRHFEIILESMSEGILEITPEGRIIYANPAAISLIGLPEGRLLGLNITELVLEEDRKRVKERLMSRDGYINSSPNDPPISIQGKQVSAHFLVLPDENHQTIVTILKDVTEQKRMEAQFLQAQKMEAIGTLAGGIAHDFNNLLMVIQGNASLMLLDTEPSHPHYEMLLGIEKKVQSGSQLTNQLLGYARKGRYEIKPIQLNQLVEETSFTFERAKKEITVHRKLAEDLFPIEADQGQMEQVLMNLFVNAADAMPGGGDLFLETANVNHKDLKGRLYDLKKNDYVMITARDTGIGMDAKTMERIFDPFFTTKELGRGTGLGLASVYGIIKGHGGHIDVESEREKGATFRIYLPASRKMIFRGGKTTEEIIKGTGTILLVDDEEMVLQVGEQFLKVMGYNVLAFSDGRKAVEIYEKHHETIDLVILDIVMPHMEGGEVFNRLKAIHPEVKVLLSSGYSIDGEATKILDRGCNGFIQKPFDIKQLSQSIHAILRPVVS
jgi:PAS domain S-box-containing protein